MYTDQILDVQTLKCHYLKLIDMSKAVKHKVINLYFTALHLLISQKAFFSALSEFQTIN